MAGLHELVAHVHGHVDRNGERQAHVAAGAAEDLRVDADHFALQVEQRAAGVAGVHRHVRLDEGHVVAVASLGSEREVALTMPAVALFSKPNGEPMASTHSPGLQFRRIADAHGRQVLRLDLDHGDVGALIDADDLRLDIRAGRSASR